MIKFITNKGSLEIKSGDTVLLLTPMSNLAFTSLDLYNDVPTITLYNSNVGINETLFTAQLSQVADSDGNFFTVDSFLTYASLNFGMTMTESSTPSSGTSDSLIHKFPIKNGETIVENTFVQLDDNGEIFNIESTGSVPMQFPIGSGKEYSSTTSPSETANNLVRFVDDTQNFIMFYSHRENFSDYQGMFIGGQVDSLGNFDFKNAPVKGNDARYINFEIDQTTYGQSTVKGLCTFSETPQPPLSAQVFEYDVATQVFTFGQTQVIDSNLGGNNFGKGLVNVGSDKYLVAGGGYSVDEEVFILTVSGTVITKQTPTVVAQNQGASTFLKITNDKVIQLSKSMSYSVQAQVLSISGNTISLGTVTSSSWQEYGFIYDTDKLDSNNRFYLYQQNNNGGNGFIKQQTYDSATDTVSFDDATTQLTNLISPTDMFFDLVTDKIVISGAINYNFPSVSVMKFGANVINSTIGVASQQFVGAGMNSLGNLVFNYNAGGNTGTKGTATYGSVGDIVSNLDYSGLIGVATDSVGSVKISGSVVTDSNLTLAINQDVYVDGSGVVSTNFTAGAFVIGYAISSTSYILNINK